MDTRAIGLQVIALGGGRHLASDNVDARVGFSAVVARGQRIEIGQLLARVHAADEASADAAQRLLPALFDINEEPPAAATSLLLERLAEPVASA
jgi:thymidine phosphorylase